MCSSRKSRPPAAVHAQASELDAPAADVAAAAAVASLFLGNSVDSAAAVVVAVVEDIRNEHL